MVFQKNKTQKEQEGLNRRPAYNSFNICTPHKHHQALLLVNVWTTQVFVGVIIFITISVLSLAKTASHPLLIG